MLQIIAHKRTSPKSERTMLFAAAASCNRRQTVQCPWWAYKGCPCVAVGYRCGEDMERAGEKSFFDLVTCLTSTWHWILTGIKNSPSPSHLWQGLGLLKVLLFTKEKSFASSLFLELEMFWKPTGSRKLWCVAVVVYFSLFETFKMHPKYLWNAWTGVVWCVYIYLSVYIHICQYMCMCLLIFIAHVN